MFFFLWRVSFLRADCIPAGVEWMFWKSAMVCFSAQRSWYVRHFIERPAKILNYLFLWVLHSQQSEGRVTWKKSPPQLRGCLTRCAPRATMRASERKWRKSKHADDLLAYQSLLSSFSPFISAAKSSFYQTENAPSFSNPKKLFSVFSNLLGPPCPPPPSTLLPS